MTIAGAGVTYESGSGDYAEWLERQEASEKLSAADIVGVYGGKITRQTGSADHVMVISVKPIVLGNMPAEGREADYEMVAFMGQTPVKVRGRVRIGDFIVPSGREDGTGVAVRPDDLTAAQLGSVVGVAWEENTLAFGIVNMAVGLKSADIGKVISRQERVLTTLADENAAMRAELSRIAAQLDELVRHNRR